MSIPARRYFDKGVLAFERGEFSSAVENLSSAGELVPSFVPTWVMLSLAYAATGAHDASARALQQAIARSVVAAQRGELYRLLGDTWLRLGDIAQAKVAFDEAIRLLGEESTEVGDPVSRAHLGLAACAAKNGDWDTVISQLRAG